MEDKTISSTIARAMDILRVLAKNPYEYRISEIREELKLSRTSINRVLKTLQLNNMVIRNPETKKYKIGPFAYHIGNVYLDNSNYVSRVLEILNEISNRLKASSGMAKREGDEVISIFSVENYKPIRINYVPGTYYPMNRGCYGKCLMAYHDREKVVGLLKKQTFKKLFKNTLTGVDEILLEYDKIVEQGYVVSVEETYSLAVGVGIPVLNSNKTVRHCVAVSFLKDSLYLDRIKESKKVLFEYSDELNNLIP